MTLDKPHFFSAEITLVTVHGFHGFPARSCRCLRKLLLTAALPAGRSARPAVRPAGGRCPRRAARAQRPVDYALGSQAAAQPAMPHTLRALD